MLVVFSNKKYRITSNSASLTNSLVRNNFRITPCISIFYGLSAYQRINNYNRINILPAEICMRKKRGDIPLNSQVI
jgi:hypothetical protein